MHGPKPGLISGAKGLGFLNCVGKRPKTNKQVYGAYTVKFMLKAQNICLLTATKVIQILYMI